MGADVFTKAEPSIVYWAVAGPPKSVAHPTISASNTLALFEARNAEYPLNLQNIRYGDRYAVIRGAVSMLDKNQPMSLSMVEALWSRAVDDHRRYFLTSEKNIAALPEPPWPEGSFADYLESVSDVSEIHRNFPIEQGESITFPQGLGDSGDNSEFGAFFRLVPEAAIRLSPKDQEKMLEWALSLCNSVPSGDWDEYSAMIFSFIDRSPKKDLLQTKAIQEFILLMADPRKRPPGVDEIEQAERLQGLEITLSILRHGEILGAIADMDNDIDMRIGLGYLITNRSFVETIHDVRLGLQNNKGDTKIYTSFERMARMLMGVDPNNTNVPVYESLSQLYRDIRFGDYKPNQEILQWELDFLHRFLTGSGLVDGKILDAGCATGRITIGLAKMGVKNISGIDMVDEHIRQARQDAKAAGVDTLFEVGDWNNLYQIESGSVDCIIWTGRDLGHVESRGGLNRVFTEFNRILKEGGVVVFNSADPNSGEYLRNRQKHLEVLDRFYKPIEWLFGKSSRTLRDIDVVIDGPDSMDADGADAGKSKIHMFNRYSPQAATLRDEGRQSGFYVQKMVGNVPIRDGDRLIGRDVYYVAVKDKRVLEKPVKEPYAKYRKWREGDRLRTKLLGDISALLRDMF